MLEHRWRYHSVYTSEHWPGAHSFLCKGTIPDGSYLGHSCRSVEEALQCSLTFLLHKQHGCFPWTCTFLQDQSSCPGTSGMWSIEEVRRWTRKDLSCLICWAQKQPENFSTDSLMWVLRAKPGLYGAMFKDWLYLTQMCEVIQKY